MPSKVIDKNPHDKIIEELKKLDAKNVSVGWHEDAEPYPDGTRVQLVACVHEFGTPTIPMRPILSMSFDSRKREYGALMDLAVENIIAGGSANDGLVAIGRKMKSDVQRDFTILSFVPLSQSTRDRKGHSTPLIDTGHLKSTVDFKVNFGISL